MSPVTRPADNIAAFQKGLAGAGYIEGRDLTIEYRPIAEEARLPEVAAELVRRRVAVIVAPGKHAGGPRGETRKHGNSNSIRRCR